MARLWSCGFELQSGNSGIEVQNMYGSGINTSVVHSGAASYLLGGSITTMNSSGLDHQLAAAQTTLFYRTYFYISALDNSASVAWSVDIQSGTTSVISCQISNVGGTYSMIAYYNNFTSNLSPVNLPGITGGWHYIEVKYDSTPADGAEILEVKLDSSIISTANTLTYTLKTVNRVATGIYNGTGSTITGSNVYVDDIAVNNTSNTPAGNGQTSYPDVGFIVYLRPNAPGDNTGFTLGAGSSNWSAVSEVTPDDLTSYVTKTTSGFVTDDYNVQSSSSAGITASDSIKLVSVGIRAGSNGTATGKTINSRIKSASGGTVTSGTTIDYTVNGWWTNGSAGAQEYKLTSYTDPVTGLAWTPTGTNSLDNMQIGIGLSNSNTTVRRITSTWALVEYVPAPPPSSVNSGFFAFM